MKVYISGPMSGLPNYNKAAFEQAADELRSRGYEVISPIELDKASGYSTDQDLSAKYWELLGRDITEIGTSGIDLMLMLPGWQCSKGARLEAFQALLLDIPIYDYETLRPLSRERVFEIITASFFSRQFKGD